MIGVVDGDEIIFVIGDFLEMVYLVGGYWFGIVGVGDGVVLCGLCEVGVGYYGGVGV